MAKGDDGHPLDPKANPPGVAAPGGSCLFYGGQQPVGGISGRKISEIPICALDCFKELCNRNSDQRR